MNWLRAELPAPEPLLEGDMLLYPDAILEPELLYQNLQSKVSWQSGEIRLYGRTHRIPRLQCWMADAPEQYQYSGQSLTNTDWIDELTELRDELNQALGTAFNSVLCNFYRTGEDSMGWHSDDEPELGPSPVIASVTLGATRDFAVRQRGATKQHSVLPLPHGSLLVMQSGMQTRWQHALPKRKGIDLARINLTFREIV